MTVVAAAGRIHEVAAEPYEIAVEAGEVERHRRDLEAARDAENVAVLRMTRSHRQPERQSRAQRGTEICDCF